MDVAEVVAHLMCENDVRMREKTLDGFVNEVERTWGRYLPEARLLLESMARRGLRIVNERTAHTAD